MATTRSLRGYPYPSHHRVGVQKLMGSGKYTTVYGYCFECILYTVNLHREHVENISIADVFLDT